MLTLTEFIFQQYQGDGYDTIEEVKEDLHQLLDSNIHDGDCTKRSHTCLLCLLEIYLDEYWKYCKTELNKN